VPPRHRAFAHTSENGTKRFSASEDARRIDKHRESLDSEARMHGLGRHRRGRADGRHRALSGRGLARRRSEAATASSTLTRCRKPRDAGRSTFPGRSRTIAGLAAGLLGASVAGYLANVPGSADASASTTVAVGPAADTYVTSSGPDSSFGSAVRVQASDQPGHHKVAYIRFAVPNVAGQSITAAQLVVTRDSHHLDSRVYANAVADTSWDESTTTFLSAPAVGSVLDEQDTTAQTNTVSFNVLPAVRSNSAVTLALTSDSTTGFASFRSREWGPGAPQLVLTLGTPVVGPPSASSTPSTSPSSAPPKGAPSASSSSSVASPPQPIGSTGCVTDAKGIPSSRAYVGAAVSGTADLSTLERHIGRPLAIHRSYFQPSQVDYAIASVKDDLAAGRLPWISFKMPFSWADMAAGKGDAWAADLADKLAKVGGPVWLAFHHEPEGDGPMQDWKRMQQHLASIIHARTDNVAFTVILVAWDDFFGPAEYNIDSIWPGEQYVDVLGMDVYNEYGAKASSDTMLDPMKYFGVIGPWARAHNVGWAIAETAYTQLASQTDSNWLQTEYRDLVSQGGLALTYFDSSLNSIADWTLDTPSKLSEFTQLVQQSPRICS
jgi:hypothetical protein